MDSLFGQSGNCGFASIEPAGWSLVDMPKNRMLPLTTGNSKINDWPRINPGQRNSVRIGKNWPRTIGFGRAIGRGCIGNFCMHSHLTVLRRTELASQRPLLNSPVTFPTMRCRRVFPTLQRSSRFRVICCTTP